MKHVQARLDNVSYWKLKEFAASQGKPLDTFLKEAIQHYEKYLKERRDGRKKVTMAVMSASIQDEEVKNLSKEEAQDGQ